MTCNLPVTMAFTTCTPPATGNKITIESGKLQVPDEPIIPFIRGDGTGPDIWAAAVRVLDEAVKKAYGGSRRIAWFEVFAGEESFRRFNNWLPDDTIAAFREYLVGIKGPLTTPVGVVRGSSGISFSARSMYPTQMGSATTLPVWFFPSVRGWSKPTHATPTSEGW